MLKMKVKGCPNPHKAPFTRRTRGCRHQKLAKHSPLLALPAELRVQIYELVFQGRILIQGNKPNKELEVAKAAWNPYNTPVVRPRYRLSHQLDNDDIDAGLVVSPALLLVCKQIKHEAGAYLYSQPVFCFASIATINKFLNVASPTGVPKIKALELHHEGYGNPTKAGHRWLKTVHDHKWRAVCRRIADTLPEISFLKLNVAITDMPLTMHSQDRWFRNLLELVHGHLIDHVEVALSHRMIGQDRIVRAARRLENRMMTAEGQHLRDEREAKRAIQLYYETQARAEAARLDKLKMLPSVQAKSILKIVVDASKVKKDDLEAGEGVKKYYTSKLDRYAKECVYGGNWPMTVGRQQPLW